MTIITGTIRKEKQIMGFHQSKGKYDSPLFFFEMGNAKQRTCAMALAKDFEKFTNKMVTYSELSWKYGSKKQIQMRIHVMRSEIPSVKWFDEPEPHSTNDFILTIV